MRCRFMEGGIGFPGFQYAEFRLMKNIFQGLTDLCIKLTERLLICIWPMVNSKISVKFEVYL
jgi:hypothetical protein